MRRELYEKYPRDGSPCEKPQPNSSLGWGFYLAARFEVSVRPGVSTLAIAVPPLGRWMFFFKRLRVLEPSLRHKSPFILALAVARKFSHPLAFGGKLSELLRRVHWDGFPSGTWDRKRTTVIKVPGVSRAFRNRGLVSYGVDCCDAALRPVPDFSRR